MKQYSWNMARKVLQWIFCSLLVISAGARAQEGPPPFKPEEIEALVAPIALYPDSLLTQVLMAATYPLEVVQAARWVKAHPDIKGEDAVKAVENENWDVSVKSLVAFPQILEPMNEKIDWTQKLGDAFLADEGAVLDAVQRLRRQAEQAGNLKSNEQQKVVIEQASPQEKIIIIQPASPEVIYVPAYNPTVVYGVWSYPAYPPYYWPPPPYYYPGGAFVSGFAWGLGIAAAGAIFGDCHWGHHGHYKVKVDINRTINIDRNFDRNRWKDGNWSHDPSHRKGVSYRDNASREKYGRNVPGADGRRDYRGRDGGTAGLGDRSQARDQVRSQDRMADQNRMRDQDRAREQDRMRDQSRTREQDRTRDRSSSPGSMSDRSRPSDERGGMDRSGAFQGVGGGSPSRDFDRGNASNRSFESSRSRAAGQPGSLGGTSRGGFTGGDGGRGGRR